MGQEKIQIAAVCIETNCPGEVVIFDSIYAPFSASAKPDIRVRIHHKPFKGRKGKKIFDCQPIWSFHRAGKRRFIDMFQEMPGLQRTLAFQVPLDNADLYLKGEPSDPFHGPAMELLMINYLAQGHGLVLHACGVVREDKGILFVGDSGAGKSTMANLWAEAEGVDVLSDDRTIVRKKGDEFRMYGTPWHGEGKFGSPGSAKVEKIFFIGHGEENAARDVKGVDATARLVVCSFPPYWDPEGMAFSLGFIGELAARVACRELRFRPERGVVEFLMKGFWN
jgi:hypothetical protein